MMPSLGFVTSLTAALILSHHIAFANPVPSEKGAPTARATTGYVDCDDKQKTKLKQGFADAVTLAVNAVSIDTNSKAWSHYFRSNKGKDTDLEHAKSIWSMIGSNNDPTNPPFEFSVRCGKADHPSCKDGKSLAITDAQPQDGKTLREMLICPLFFKDDSKETNHDLNFRKFEKPARGKDNSWCAPGNNFPWYEVAGHTLLHEMTHLDVVGKTAGVPERQVNDDKNKPWFKTHGSDDVGGLGNSYPVAARKLTEIWENGLNGEGTLEPYQNAENLAAAALEWFMMEQCEKSGFPIPEIPL